MIPHPLRGWQAGIAGRACGEIPASATVVARPPRPCILFSYVEHVEVLHVSTRSTRPMIPGMRDLRPISIAASTARTTIPVLEYVIASITHSATPAIRALVGRARRARRPIPGRTGTARRSRRRSTCRWTWSLRSCQARSLNWKQRQQPWTTPVSAGEPARGNGTLARAGWRAPE